MQLKMSTNYAIQTLLYMATKEEYLVSSSELSKELNIPIKYVQKILMPLKDAHILRAERGVHGGYRLNMYPEDISLYDIFKVMEATVCFLPEESGIINKTLEEMYETLQRKINNELRDINLSMLMQ